MTNMVDKLYIGIDISLNSTGICFNYKGNTEFISVSSKLCYTTSKKKTTEEIIKGSDILNSLSNSSDVTLVVVSRDKTTKSDDFMCNQRDQLEKSVLSADIIFASIQKLFLEKYSEINRKDIVVGIESYSYGSIGDQLVQIVELSTLIKYKVIKYLLNDNYENFYSIPGPRIKSFAGGGNFDKYQMYKSYLENTSNKKSEFFTFLLENELLLTESSIKPLKSSMTISTNENLYYNSGTVLNEITVIGINDKPKKTEKKFTISEKGKIWYANKPELVAMKLKKKITLMKTPISDLVDAYWISKCVESIIK